jgi:hypothetical protein
MSKSSLLAERGRGRPGDDLECEVYPGVIKGHDVHDDDFQVDMEDDVQEERKETTIQSTKLMDQLLLVN